MYQIEFMFTSKSPFPHNLQKNTVDLSYAQGLDWEERN